MRYLDWTIFNADKELVGAVRYAEDAAAMVAFYGAGSKVKYLRRWIVWTEGTEEFPAGESYDRAGGIMLSRATEKVQKAYRRKHGILPIDVPMSAALHILGL